MYGNDQNKVDITITVSKEMKDKLDEIVKEDSRTLNSVVFSALREFINNRPINKATSQDTDAMLSDESFWDDIMNNF